MHVQYGAGWENVPQDWVNFDASPTLRFERLPVVGRLYTKNGRPFPKHVAFGDVTRRLPVADRSCDGVYCSHVLEHLSLEDFEVALKETYRILKPGGIFRAVVPDLQVMAEEYVEGVRNRRPDAALAFMTQTYLGKKKRQRGVAGAVVSWLGNGDHLWMWDGVSLMAKLEEHGFIDIRKAEFNDSEDPVFKSVEEERRFKRACAVQARRPG